MKKIFWLLMALLLIGIVAGAVTTNKVKDSSGNDFIDTDTKTVKQVTGNPGLKIQGNQNSKPALFINGSNTLNSTIRVWDGAIASGQQRFALADFRTSNNGTGIYYENSLPNSPANNAGRLIRMYLGANPARTTPTFFFKRNVSNANNQQMFFIENANNGNTGGLMYIRQQSPDYAFTIDMKNKNNNPNQADINFLHDGATNIYKPLLYMRQKYGTGSTGPVSLISFGINFNASNPSNSFTNGIQRNIPSWLTYGNNLAVWGIFQLNETDNSSALVVQSMSGGVDIPTAYIRTDNPDGGSTVRLVSQSASSSVLSISAQGNQKAIELDDSNKICLNSGCSSFINSTMITLFNGGHSTTILNNGTDTLIDGRVW